jgi:eukaryotic-like serine/threonine-protein kinase
VKTGDRLSERYEILRELGRGGAGVTYLARDATSGRDVVAKILHVGLMGDWKTAELFQREAAVLSQLHHERIPAYVDFFPIDDPEAPRFVLVREFVDGQSLQSRVDAGWRGTEEDIRDIGVRLLRVVQYIHDVRPPVIHRDINPRNVISRPDGEVFLVDFGGVQDAIRLSTGGTATVVGTPGYTPMEQFVGRATVRSDLYAVAATLLFLLTHRNPADLPARNMKIDVAAVIDITAAGLRAVLDNWLEPDEEKRTLSVEKAVALLQDAEPWPGNLRRDEAAEQPPVPRDPPHGSRIRRSDADGRTSFLVPGGAGGRRGVAPFGIVWLVLIGVWASSNLRGHAPLPVDLSYIPFIVIVVSMFVWPLVSAFRKLGLSIGADGLTYTRSLFFWHRSVTVPLDDVGECRIEQPMEHRGRWGYPRSGYRRSRPSGRLCLDVGARTLRFGEMLSEHEREWLSDAINERLRIARKG